MTALTKAQKKEVRRLARVRRDSIKGDIIEARMRTAIGFAGAYVGEAVLVQMVPSLTPDPTSPLNAVGGIVDLALAGGGIYFAVKDHGELGDYALGAAMVGSTQLLDRLVGAVTTFIASRGA